MFRGTVAPSVDNWVVLKAEFFTFSTAELSIDGATAKYYRLDALT